MEVKKYVRQMLENQTANMWGLIINFLFHRK